MNVLSVRPPKCFDVLHVNTIMSRTDRYIAALYSFTSLVNGQGKRRENGPHMTMTRFSSRTEQVSATVCLAVSLCTCIFLVR